MRSSLGPLALRAGAQDYLTKGRFGGELLIRSLRYAIERQLLLNQLEVRHRKEQEAREMQLLEAVVGTSDTAMGARLFGSGLCMTPVARSSRNSPAGTATS